MERWLLILRHGKSERGPQYDTDFERPLAARGKQAAAAVGKYLAQHQPPVELIVTSTAVRALHTARLVQQELDGVELAQQERIYGASLPSLLDVVGELPDDNACVLLVGHNPGLEELAARLSDDHSILLKTCSLAGIKLAGKTWLDAIKHQGALADLQHPRELEA
jgi:phosphohistidine phosphatase